jgi:type III secretion protein U
MADKNDGADKSEMPTPKRLREARKKGDVAKSKDLGSGLLTLAWLVLFALGASYVSTEIAVLANDTVTSATTLPFDQAAPQVMHATFWTLVKVSFVTLGPVAALATLAEFLQIGPIATAEKMKFGLDKLNPMDGLKRMFGKDGLFELVKTVVKVLLIVGIAYIVVKAALSEAGQMIRLGGVSPVDDSGPGAATAVLDHVWRLTLQLFALVAGVFFFVAVADRIYAKASYVKKLKMSRRDIRQEFKDDEGDPQVKSMRREMHQEWANQNCLAATRGSAALLVNPTHIAIALEYDAENCPVPVIAAKGAGDLAAAMRSEAEAAGVPIIRNVATARTLWARGEIGEIVPQDMFDAIAAIILWAGKARLGEAAMTYDMDAARQSLPRYATHAT